MTRDPMVVLQALAPRLPLDQEALEGVRARLDAERGAEVHPGALGAEDRDERGGRRAGGFAARSRRWLPLAAAAAAVATALVLLPPPLGDEEAFASWTPRAEALSAAQGGALAAECVEFAFGSGTTDEWPKPFPAPAAFTSARFVLGERRGDTEFVIAEVGGWSAYCSRGEGGGVSLGIPADRELDLPGADVDLFGGGSHVSQEGALEHWYGAVGPEVAAVDFLLADGREVAATIGGGRLIVWWPSRTMTLDEPSSSEVAEAEVRVLLADGSVRTVEAADLIELP